MNKLLDGKERSPRTTMSDTNDVMVKRAQADGSPVKPSVDTEALTLIVLFSTAGLVLSIALAFYWPEVAAGYLGMLP
ncbi:hypothetical protein QA640_06645 [Bradyrhizobium sp. CB82]|uniref:hypothetical protein n=1 Tax=Bradyrhizobium sp. CB82 TaxID=3039159 RepID=UPI0024B1B730|nr:hypothetical protein [Bradyrhizobium sp. CB82]WFU42154.1 hypothetical protein QA640_06645 [Bradyrhizobium sp. CB82]